MINYKKLYEEEITKNAVLMQRILYLETVLQNNQEKIVELEAEANVDPLTNLYNRRGLYRILLNRLLSGTTNNIYTLVNLDLDNFKNVNDELGHKIGDEVLETISGIFRNNTRINDIIVRTGGDEFCILFANNDIESIIQRTIQIQDAVKMLGIRMFKENNKVLDINKSLSFSAGIAAYNLHDELNNQDITTTEIKFDILDKLLQKTDNKIYESKNSGKGQIIKYSSEGKKLELVKP